MWINTITLGEFALHADIRHELWKSNIEAPGVLTDEYLASVGYQVLTPIYPIYDPITERIAPRTGELVDGVWVKNFDVIPLDAATILNNRNIVEVQRVASIHAQLDEGDKKIIRAILEGDQARIEAWKTLSAELRSQL